MIEIALAVVALAAAILFYAVVASADRAALPQALKELIMSLQDTATAISGAASSLTTAAAAISDAAGKLSTINDTSVLDQPVADLNTAVSAVTDAAGKITALVPAQ